MGTIKNIKEFFSSPAMFYRYGAKVLIHTIYRTKFIGFDENIPQKGAAILISNHVSYMDGLIVSTACKRNVRFIIDEDIYNIGIVKHFMDLNGAIPIAPNRASVKRAISMVSDALDQGDLIYIFPEGQITYTGNMIRFRFGIEWMIEGNDVPVIPVALSGLWGSIFSRKNIHSRYRWIPKDFRRKVIALCGEEIPHAKAKVNYLQRSIMELKSSIDE